MEGAVQAGETTTNRTKTGARPLAACRVAALGLVAAMALGACSSGGGSDADAKTTSQSKTTTTTDASAGSARAKQLLQDGLDAVVVGNTTLADQKFRAVLAITPNSLLAHYNLGLISQKQGDLAKAEASYRRADRDRSGVCAHAVQPRDPPGERRRERRGDRAVPARDEGRPEARGGVPQPRARAQPGGQDRSGQRGVEPRPRARPHLERQNPQVSNDRGQADGLKEERRPEWARSAEAGATQKDAREAGRSARFSLPLAVLIAQPAQIAYAVTVARLVAFSVFRIVTVHVDAELGYESVTPMRR